MCVHYTLRSVERVTFVWVGVCVHYTLRSLHDGYDVEVLACCGK